LFEGVGTMEKEQGNNPGVTVDPLKTSLLAKYRTIFVDRLSPRDLEELKVLLKNKFGSDRSIHPDYQRRFELRLRDYFHEEILTREMASVELLVEKLGPEDLKRKF
jgi:hypothetical protein